MKHFAIALQTPDDVCKAMANYAGIFESKGLILRTGGAHGADKAFASGVKSKKMIETYVPWRGFNSIDTLFDSPTEKALETAERYHKNWRNLKQGAKLLHGRNAHIILGENCDDPVDFVVCWTKDGKDSGGTGLGMRIAKAKKIPVYNLYLQKDVDSLNMLIVTLGD